MKCTSSDPFAAMFFLPLFIVVGSAMLYHVFNTKGLESFRDPKHWAGKAGFIWNSMRVTYGIGYTAEGKRLWWRSARFLIPAFLLVFSFVYLIYFLISHGYIQGQCV